MMTMTMTDLMRRVVVVMEPGQSALLFAWCGCFCCRPNMHKYFHVDAKSYSSKTPTQMKRKEVAVGRALTFDAVVVVVVGHERMSCDSFRSGR
jgi:phage terminase large subunit-like protein